MIKIRNKLQAKAENLKFKSIEHEYNLQGRKLISVTQLVKMYTPDFDPTGFLTIKCANELGITPRQMKEQWEAQGKLKADKGTETHKIAEIILNGGKLTPEQKEGQKTHIIALYHSLYDTYKDHILATEQLIYNEDLLIAGTVDLMLSDGKVIDIYDHKNYEKYDKKGRNRMAPDYYQDTKMLSPLHHIPANNYYRSALQQSWYRYILEQDGFVVRNLALIHLTDKPEIIPLPYLKDEIDLIVGDIKHEAFDNNKPTKN